MALRYLYTLSLLILLIYLQQTPITAANDVIDTNLYFSKPTILIDYQNMLKTFKIFIYPNHLSNSNYFNFTTPPLSLFYNSLLNSNFLTNDPNEAHLFFLPFTDPQSTRSLARLVQHIRSSYPFWDRSLGADHFYVSCHGVGPSSTRNVVELRKNAIQVSCFPSQPGHFIPHKDVTLSPPPTVTNPAPALSESLSTRWLGYLRFDPVQSGLDLINWLMDDPEFLIESEPSDQSAYVERLRSSKFCLFVYDGDQEVGLGEALSYGCIPVIITDRPIQDLPLMDLIRWSEIALFVGSRVGHEQLKRELIRTWQSGVYEKMRSLGVAAAHHFGWNEPPQPYDAFSMVMYQLWVRRYVIRYARWDDVHVEVSQA